MIGAVGSMLASSLSLELYCIGEGKRGNDKIESLYNVLLEEVGMILFKITLVYFENYETQDDILRENVSQLIKTVSNNMKPVSSSDDEYNTFKNTIFQYFVCSLLIPIKQTVNQFE